MNPQLNMVGMNTAGGPVGAIQMMNQAGSRGPPAADNQRVLLNTYIYDYLLKNHHYNLARSFQHELQVNSQPRTKQSPSRRDVNGVDDAMDTDSKDGVHKRPDDLPDPSIPSTSSENCFLYDWWCQFWDIYGAQRKQPNSGAATTQYLNHNIQQTRMRQDSQNRMLRGGDPNMMMGGMNYNIMRMQQNGRPLNPLQQQAMANNRNLTPQQQLQMKNQMMQNNMQRDGSGNGPQSPSSGDNAPSPSKRQKLDGQGSFGGQMGPAGRGQGMPGQVPGGPNAQMMLANGMNELPQGALQKMEGMTPGGAQGSPMLQQNAEGFIDGMPGGRVMAGGPGQQTPQGNHALHDYQMQLMLLEQQNKKRLLMARQEQENITQPPPSSAPMGAQGPGFAPTMSPSGSRAGPSPNPTDQMKRGTPKMGQVGVPGSPMPDGMAQNRGSPVPNFDPSQMPPNMPQQYYAQMGPNGIMRPPSSHPNFNMANMNPQMQEAIRANGGRLPNGMPWPPQPGQQQMMPQNQGGPQPAQMGTPRQPQNAMPPPPAPQVGGEQAQRTQPSSPAQPAAPPTPSQTNKANPKTKKDNKESRKKQTKAKAGATPASEPEQPPPTPTPSTPITPMHPQSFGGNQKNGVTQQANQQQPQQPAAAAQPVAAPPMDAQFGSLDDNNNGFNLDFSSVLDGPDVLESFDFDSFLHTGNDDNGLAFDPNFGFNPDGVEAGTGDIA